jgi:hypothetical protein
MPLSTFTSSVDIEELIPTELVDEFVAGFEYPLGAGMLVAQRKPGRGNIPVRFPRWNQIDLSGIGTSHAETVDAVDVDTTTTESSITPAMQIFRMPFPDEADVASLGKVPAQALAEALRALGNRIDVNVLAASTSATLATGAVGTALTLQGLRAAIMYANAQNIPTPSYNVVLSNSAAGSLWESMGSTGATYALSADDLTRFGAQSGYQGRLLGQGIFQSNNVATESTGFSNFMVPVNSSSLGVVVQEMPNLRPTRGDEAELRAVSFVVVRAWWGAGIINPRQFVELLSS